MINKIVSLKLIFQDQEHTEEFLISKGFIKIAEDKCRWFRLDSYGLSLFHTTKGRKTTTWNELAIYIDDGKVKRYNELEEFEITRVLNILKEIDINTCNFIELHGLGDIRQQLINEDKNWVEPEWLRGSLLYIDEHNGLSYHQHNGFYRICYDDNDKEINVQNLFGGMK